MQFLDGAVAEVSGKMIGYPHKTRSENDRFGDLAILQKALGAACPIEPHRSNLRCPDVQSAPATR